MKTPALSTDPRRPYDITILNGAALPAGYRYAAKQIGGTWGADKGVAIVRDDDGKYCTARTVPGGAAPSAADLHQAIGINWEKFEAAERACDA